MKYEVHATVQESSTIPAIFGGKTIHLSLMNGYQRHQTIVGAKGEFTSYDEAKEWAESLKKTLRQMGYNVIRLKLEAEVNDWAAPSYREAHWKFAPQNIEDVVEILKKAKELKLLVSWHRSRSVMWLTFRAETSFGVAEAEYNRLRKKLETLSSYKGGHFEDVYFDTNIALDGGWTPPA